MTDRKRNLILVNLLVTCIASSFLSTALTTALPPIITDFGIDAAKGQWLTSAYSMAMAIMMPMTAFLITRFSTKKLYTGALVCVITGLAVCAAAPCFEIMMAGRILQALSNGITTSLAQVVLLTIFPPEKKGSVMGLYGLSLGAAPVIAPTLAGILVDISSWRMIFVITVIVLTGSLVFALKVFDDVLETSKKSFDTLSFILCGIAFGGITLGIGGMSGGVIRMETLLTAGAGLICGIFFIIRQLGLEEAFLDVRVFRSRVFTISVISSMFLYFIMMGASIMLPLYIQTLMGRTATVSGLVTLPGAFCMAIISPFAGRAYDRAGMRLLAVSGSVCLFIAAFAMVFFTLQTPLWLAAAMQVIRCMAIGFMMMPFVTWGVTSLPAEQTAHGTALLTSLRTISGAIGMAVFVGIMSGGNDRMPTIEGMNAAYMFMTCLCIIMIFMEVIFVKKSQSGTGGPDRLTDGQ